MTSNGMPLAHDARRLRREFAAGNPFVTPQRLADHLAAMISRYMRTTNVKVSHALHVEIDLMGEVVGGEC